MIGILGIREYKCMRKKMLNSCGAEKQVTVIAQEKYLD